MMKSLKYFFIVNLIFIFSCDKLITSINSDGWTLQREKQDNITYYSIFFTDKDNGWICGSSGTIMNSSDGGNTWNFQNGTTSSDLWEIYFINKNQGWVCGSEKTILKTLDGGNNWVNISPSGEPNILFIDIKFFDENYGWTSNNKGEILKSTDGGESWEIKMNHPIGGAKIAVFDKNTIYASTTRLYKTFDGGETWDTVSISRPKNYFTSDIFFTDVTHGWCSTENGTGGTIINDYYVMYTTDGGNNWFLSNMIRDGSLKCCYFVDNKIGWTAGVDNIYKTTDGGRQWNIDFTSNHGLYAKDMCFVNENCGWIINGNGIIYKFKNLSFSE